MGRGEDLTTGGAEATQAAYHKIKEEIGKGRPVGATKVKRRLPGNFKRSSVTRLLATLREGENDGDLQAGRKRKPAKVIAVKAKRILDVNSSSVTNSTREIAGKTRTSQTSVRKILTKKLRVRPSKFVRTTKNATATLRKRERIANQT